MGLPLTGVLCEPGKTRGRNLVGLGTDVASDPAVGSCLPEDRNAVSKRHMHTITCHCPKSEAIHKSKMGNMGHSLVVEPWPGVCKVLIRSVRVEKFIVDIGSTECSTAARTAPEVTAE